MIKQLLFAGIMATTLIGSPVAASSTTTTFSASIPVTTIVRGEAGESIRVAGIDSIDADYQGMSCSVIANAANQGSVHPGNNLVVSSGTSSVVLADVERAPGVTTTTTGSLTLTDTVDVTLILGEDKVSSAGMDVELTCVKEIKDIEVCRDGEVLTIGEDEQLPTDTAAPCSVPQIEVCRDGEIINIDEDAKLEGDTSAPCPVPQIEVCRDGAMITIDEGTSVAGDTYTCATKGFSVCRDGKVLTITENDFKDTDVRSNSCPEVKSEVTVTELPKTGATETTAFALIGATLLSGSYGLVRSKQ